MKRTDLNLSQKEIAMSEAMALGKNSVNTISVKIELPTFASETVKGALNGVLASADVFSAKLDTSGDAWGLLYGATPVSFSRVVATMTKDEAHRYMEASDRLPMDITNELYLAEIIPLVEGGCIVYVRFHHIIIDGFGMSLFAQKVLDVLGGRECCVTSFAENTGTQKPSDDAVFWQNYFDEAEFEAAIFSEKGVGTDFTAYNFSCKSDFCDLLIKFAKANDLTPAYVFASAYALYLAEATGKKDAVFLMPRLARTQEQMSTIGCYTLLVPVRVTVNQNESFSQLCHRVEIASREASAHKNFGYDKILENLRDNDIVTEAISEYVFNFYRYEFNTDIPQ